MEYEAANKATKPSKISKWWQSLTKLFVKPTTTSSTESNSSTSAAEAVQNEDAHQESRWQKIRDSLQEFVSKNLEFPDDDNKLLNSITAYIYFARNLFQHIGHQDGRIPSRDYSILSLTTNQATMLAEHVCSKLEERIVANEEMISAFSTAQQQQSATCTSWQVFQDEMTNFYHRHYQSFSQPTAYLSIFFGFILMVADIPLSLALVGNFDVGVEHPDGGVWEKLTDIELLTFSFGIAFSTIYIKILYDEYISNRLGTFSNLAIIPTRIPASPTTGTQQVNLLSIQGEFRMKLVVKLIILVALLSMLIYLGWFRNMYSPFAVAETYPNSQNANPTFAPESVVHVRLMSFILITVVVPIISGISLSTGFSIIHNRKILRKCEIKLGDLNRELEMLNEKLVALRAKSKEFVVALNNWQQPNKITIIAREFAGFYEQGFNRTFRELFGNDLFKQVTVARNECVGALLNTKVQSSLDQSHEN